MSHLRIRLKHHRAARSLESCSKLAQTVYFELRRISSIRNYLTEDATKTLVTSCILSRLDYCNCLLMGTPNSVIQPLQKVQNSAVQD